jgi:hypothetical protein
MHAMQTRSSNSPASSVGEGGASVHGEGAPVHEGGASINVSNIDGKTHWSPADEDYLVAFVETNINRMVSNATFKNQV